VIGDEVLVDVIYRFGDFELDAVRFEQRPRGTCADVQPKVLRLLLQRELLCSAAVLGIEFSAGILPRVAEQSATDTRTPAQLSAAERTALHRRAGSAIEAHGITDNCELLAEVTKRRRRALPEPCGASRRQARSASFGEAAGGHLNRTIRARHMLAD
jgi:hypothetical protein